MDISAWLRELGLERYDQAFRQNDIVADILPKLTADDDLALALGNRRWSRTLTTGPRCCSSSPANSMSSTAAPPCSVGSLASTGSRYTTQARILAAWRAIHVEQDHRAAEVMRDFLTRRAAMRTVALHSYFLMLLADAWLRLSRPGEAAAAIKEGLARAQASGEHFCTAELHRLRASACLARDASDAQGAEAALDAALADARRRSSRIFELRAACDLARLWSDRGERRNDHDLLAPIYGWFTEGFNTADLKAAKALLVDLA